jgi:BASS family bile acid:Na+ symporter
LILAPLAALYLRHEFSVAALQLAFAMLGMGALLRPRDFAAVFAAPRSLLTGIALQLVAVPAVAGVVAATVAPATAIATGLALVAAVPGGSMSNLLTFLARGNAPLSIALTAVTTAACLATTPFLLGVLAPEISAGALVMPVARVATDIGLFLALPLVAGMALGAGMPEYRHLTARWAIRASVTLIGVMAAGAAAAGRIDPTAHGWAGPLAILALALGAQGAAVLTCRGLGVPARDASAIAIEVTVRNTNLALLLKASLFPARAGVIDPVADGVLFTVLMYGGLALPASVPIVLAGRRAKAR